MTGAGLEGAGLERTGALEDHAVHDLQMPEQSGGGCSGI
jgi:hypothetical protein